MVICTPITVESFHVAEAEVLFSRRAILSHGKKTAFTPFLTGEGRFFI
jgi:hypothetical protein